MAAQELKTTVTYRSGTNNTLGAAWDVMCVDARREDGERNSFVIARDTTGRIIRKTDLILDRWEIVTDEESLRDFRHCFDERDRLLTEKTEATENG